MSLRLADFCPMEAWPEGLLLLLALAGPAGDLKNALLRRRLGCYVAESMQTVPDPHRKKKKKNTLCFPLGLLAHRELQRRSTHCCCGTPPLLDCRWISYVRAGLYLYIWSQNVLRLDDHLPHRLWLVS